MTHWREKFIDDEMLFPRDVDLATDLPGLEDLFLNTPLCDPPPGHRWKFLWSAEANNSVQSDDLAMLLFGMTKREDDYYVKLPRGDYAIGSICNRDKPWICWLSFGIGCPLQSASQEIWIAVEVNEDGAEKYPRAL